MKKVSLLAALAIAAMVLTGCSTFHESKYSAPLTIKVETDVKPEVVLGGKISGEATIQRVLFVQWGATKFAECVNYGGEGSQGGLLFTTFEDGKAAAAYDACTKANCDVIICPKYTVENDNYFVYSKVHVKVEGYQGNFKDIKK